MSFLILLLALQAGEEGPRAPAGFKVELLYSVPKEEGSWVCLTFDGSGRLIASPEIGPLRRVTLGREGARVETVGLGVGDAQGLLWAHEALYVNGRGPQGTGLYRLDGRLENPRLLRRWPIEMTEHGPHAVVKGPDGKIYVLNGNYTKAGDRAAASPHRNYAEDLLLPRQWDATGHAVGILAPGGVVWRTDPEGREWELFAGGLRNAYDLAFNAEGELFTYDSDMERDLGTPWYRPTRILHVVPGGEYGWRSGSGKWPEYYVDSLPAAVDVGRGSPTGVVFGTGSRFPARHRRACFAADWAFGRILAVHLSPRGASYGGTVETFIEGRPLNVTDLEFGPDGALYFITGGRGTASRLYRVSWTGGPEAELSEAVPQERVLRRSLEGAPGPVEDLWPHLGHADRWVRYAARRALEAVPLEAWRERALSERDPVRSITAMVALARTSGRGDLPLLLKSLFHHSWSGLSEEAKLDWLRALQLAFIRLGPPEENSVAEVLGARYPASSPAANRELSQLLVFLRAPGVVRKSLDLLSAAGAREEQTHYAFVLRTLDRGWTMDDRKAYFGWFDRYAVHSGDVGFPLFLRNIKTDAIATLSEVERKELEPLLRSEYAASGRSWRGRDPVVKEWKSSDLLPELPRVSERRNFLRGKASFAKAQCLACHRMGLEGGATGPDLTGVARRFGRRELLESILEPSRVVSDQFRATILQIDDGDVVSGRIVRQEKDRLAIQPDPLDPAVSEILLSRIRKSKLSDLSPMPEGLLNTLSLLEILDLLAFLEADGEPSDPRFPR